MRTKMILAATAIVSALVLGACGSVRPPSTVASGSQPLLRIGADGSVGLSASVQGSGSGAGMYRVDGALPTGPSRATTYLPGSPTRSIVEHVAAALGLVGAPVRHHRGWVVTSSAGQLQVADTGQWAFQSDFDSCPAFVVEVDSGHGSMGVACAAPGIVSPSSAGSAATPKPSAPMSAATLRAVATSLLVALRLDPGAATVMPQMATVWVDPVVAGLPSYGYSTDVIVENRRIKAASGWIYPSAPTAGHTYPLLGAAADLRVWAAGPRPMMGAPAIACPQRALSPSAPTSLCGGPTVVTGGRLGLTLRWDGGLAGAPVLVPAWFLTVRGESSPLVLVAVDPKFLAEPTPSATGTNLATVVSAAPGSNGEAGSAGPAAAPGGPPTGGSAVPRP